MEKAKVICVSRVKNEAWIMRRFMETASVWADIIIVYDQNSEDDTVAIAKSFEKAQILTNNDNDFTEVDYAILLEETRKIPGKKLVVYLDADECLSANITSSIEWQTMIHAKEGTVFNISIVHLDNDFSVYRSATRLWFAIMDDGVTTFSKYANVRQLHNGRIPFPKYETNLFFLYDVVVLHYSNVSASRTASKSRWYQCFERIYSKKTNLQLIRQYTPHTLERIFADKKYKFQDKWFDAYKKLGIDMTSITEQYDYWWDRKVLEYFETYGTALFRRVNIWVDKDWHSAYIHYGYKKLTQEDFKRSLLNRLVIRYARNTVQKNTRLTRFIDRVINRFY